MDELENPYRPGAGTQPPALLGRDDLLRKFETTVQRTQRRLTGKSLMPIGLRGVGKTVLLNRFAGIAESHGMRVSNMEAPETGVQISAHESFAPDTAGTRQRKAHSQSPSGASNSEGIHASAAGRLHDLSGL